MEREAYHYSIIRFVPNPVREEALNLGVILIRSNGGYADYRLLARVKSRVRLLAPRFDSRLMESFDEDLRNIVGRAGFQERLGQSGNGLTVEALRQLAQTHANQIQFTEPRAYLTSNPDDALEDLFEEFVRPRRYARGPKGILDRQQLKLAIMQSFIRWKLGAQNYRERADVDGQTGKHVFDFTLMNGKVRAAIYAVSFQMAAQEDIVLHRDHVAWAAYDIHRLQKAFPIVAVMSPPISRTKVIFDESIKMFESEGVEPVLHDDFDGMRDKLVRTLFNL